VQRALEDGTLAVTLEKLHREATVPQPPRKDEGTLSGPS
jgi:hypothetical protein